MNIYCIPFAGGSSYSYKGLSERLHPSLKAVTLELPGRGLRFSETLLPSAEALADDLFRQVKSGLDEPYALYGHSLGSLLAYLLAGRISAAGLAKPLHLFLSGCEAPSTAPRKTRHLLPKEEFREVIRRFGGCSPEVLANEELMDIFEPILRSDFKAYETYTHDVGAILDVPVSIFIGDEEELTVEDVMKWQSETRSSVSVETFEGDHFFIYRHWDAIARHISLAMGVPES